MPKKSDAKPESVLTITGDTWQHVNGQTTTGGPITQFAHWPTTLGLWNDQRAGLAPHTVGAFQLARLAKTAKHLGTDFVNAGSGAGVGAGASRAGLAPPPKSERKKFMMLAQSDITLPRSSRSRPC